MLQRLVAIRLDREERSAVSPCLEDAEMCDSHLLLAFEDPTAWAAPDSALVGTLKLTTPFWTNSPPGKDEQQHKTPG